MPPWTNTYFTYYLCYIITKKNFTIFSHFNASVSHLSIDLTTLEACSHSLYFQKNLNIFIFLIVMSEKQRDLEHCQWKFKILKTQFIELQKTKIKKLHSRKFHWQNLLVSENKALIFHFLEKQNLSKKERYSWSERIETFFIKFWKLQVFWIKSWNLSSFFPNSIILFFNIFSRLIFYSAMALQQHQIYYILSYLKKLEKLAQWVINISTSYITMSRTKGYFVIFSRHFYFLTANVWSFTMSYNSCRLTHWQTMFSTWKNYVTDLLCKTITPSLVSDI